jgi:hypothetical protein
MAISTSGIKLFCTKMVSPLMLINMAKARNMKLVLCLFEQLSGLKINFHKSELFYFGRVKEEQENYRQLFGCEIGSLLFSYLGIPIHHRKLTNKEWKCIEDRFEKNLSCWKGKLISYEGRLILVNSVLTSMPMFMLSFFEIPVGYAKDWNFIDHGSFGKVMRIKQNTGWLSGKYCVGQKTKGVWRLKIWRWRIRAYLANGYIGYPLRRRGCGYSYCLTNICTTKL